MKKDVTPYINILKKLFVQEKKDSLFSTKNIIIVVLSISLLAVTDGCGYFAPRSGTTEAVSKVDTVFVTKTHEVKNDTIAKVPKEEKQKVVLKEGKVKEVDSSFVLSEEEKASGAEELTLSEYKVKTVFPNGILTGKILYSGELYATDFKLTTTDTTFTRTTEKKTVIAQSGLYGYSGVVFGGSIRNVQTGLQYNHKNRWFIGLGVSYLTDSFHPTELRNRFGADFRVGIKL